LFDVVVKVACGADYARPVALTYDQRRRSYVIHQSERPR
jgi:hypothetical protein